MSQSDEHRVLLLHTADALMHRHPGVTIAADIQASPGDGGQHIAQAAQVP